MLCLFTRELVLVIRRASRLCSGDRSGKTNASGLCASIVGLDPNGLHFLTANSCSQLTPVLHSALLTPMTGEFSLVCFESSDRQSWVDMPYPVSLRDSKTSCRVRYLPSLKMTTSPGSLRSLLLMKRSKCFWCMQAL